MADTGTFVKGGRTWIYETSVAGTFKGIYYETNENEFNRVRNKNYTIVTNPDAPVSQQITDIVTGERYTGRVPDPNNPDDRSKDKFYVQTLYFEQQSNGTWTDKVLPPGQETANGNATQSKAIVADVSIKQQITGKPANPNVATTPPSSPQITGSTSANIDLNLRLEAEPSSYVYPITMDENQDFIRFRIFKLKKNPNADITQVPEILKRTGGGKGPFGIKADLESYDGPIGSPIILPIQASIVDQNSVNWGGGELNELQRMLAEASAAGMGSDDTGGIASAFNITISKIFGNVKTHPDQYKNILYGALLEQAVNAPALTSRLFGGVLNPNMELLFQGPQLRPFNFTFKMSPRSKPEADTVKKIIRAFKRNMAPKVEGIFLQAPNVFKIEYVHGKTNNVHKSINLIKMCSLQNCSVDYTPLQTYMTFDDVSDPEASMVSYNMSLTFSEITPVYQDDYDAEEYDSTTGKGHPIGF